MKKVLVYGIVFALIGSTCAFGKSKKTNEPQIQSTQGIEVNSAISEKITKSKNNKNPAKVQRKNRKKYLRYVNKVDSAGMKKIKKERDLEFLNNQLKIKKHKLEELNSEVKKGENQK